MRNTRNSKERIYYFDNLKAVLITCVVIGHFAEQFYGNWDAYKSLWLFLYSFHMPLFILVTGYFAKNIVSENGVFNVAKTLNILVLYLLFSYARHLIVIHVGKHDEVWDPMGTASATWYLLATVLYYISVPLLRTTKAGFTIPIATIIALLVGYLHTVGDYLVISRVIVFMPFFAAGYYLNDKHAALLFRIPRLKLLRTISILALLLIAAIYYLYPEYVQVLRPMLTGRNSYFVKLYENHDIVMYGALIRLFCYAIAAAMSVFILLLIPRKKMFFTYIGASTLQIYIIHVLLIRLLLYATDIFPSLACFGNTNSAYKLLVPLIALACTFILSLTPPFGMLIRKMAGFKWSFILKNRSS